MAASDSILPKVLILGGGAAAIGAALYCLFKDEPAEEKGGAASSTGRPGGPIKPADVTKDQLLQILAEIVTAQEDIKVSMGKIRKELMSKPCTFAEAYAKVKGVQPDDVLERYSLSMPEFDELLGKHHEDERVNAGIMKIMGAPDMGSAADAKGATLKQIVDAHRMMLEELKKVAEHVESTRASADYDFKAVALTAQAFVAAKVEEKFDLTSEDMEAAVAKHHTSLATDQEFISLSTEMQDTMGKLMGGLQ